MTDALAASRVAEHTVAVRVNTRPNGVEFDLNDDCSLSGIFRGVTLFASPLQHVSELTTSTGIAPDDTAAMTVSAWLSARRRGVDIAHSARQLADV
ncbi:MAG: hypothetical protein V4857_16925 [Pseudomonadota bacterium]